MRMPHPTPTAEPLPFEHRFVIVDNNTSMPPTLQLRGPAVAGFDALLHELYADAARVDDDRLRHLAAWLLNLRGDEARRVLDSRLDRLHELRSMLGDRDWDSSDATRARLAKLFAYIDRDDDLIPDHEPLLGQLDDVLLIELAWPAFADEVEDYRDFRAYCNDAHPDGAAEAKRAAWLRDRLQELALWQQRLRVHGTHYVEDAFGADAPFRVGR